MNFFPLRCTSLETFASNSAQPPWCLNFQTHKDLYEKEAVHVAFLSRVPLPPGGASEMPAGLPRLFPTGQARGRPWAGTPSPPPDPQGRPGRGPLTCGHPGMSQSARSGSRLQEAGPAGPLKETLTPARPPRSGPGAGSPPSPPPSDPLGQQTGRRGRAVPPTLCRPRRQESGL